MILNVDADKMIKRWMNQGWCSTVITVNPISCVIALDHIIDKGCDPTTHKEILYILQ